MNEFASIEFGKKMQPLDRLKYYMNYFIDMWQWSKEFNRPIKTFEQFCSEGNIIIHMSGEDWKDRHFANNWWVTLEAGSLFHSIYHNKTLLP